MPGELFARYGDAACLRSLKPVLGSTVALDVMPVDEHSPQSLVLMTRPENAGAAEKMFAHGFPNCELAAMKSAVSKSPPAQATGPPGGTQVVLSWVTRVEDGWLLIARSKAVLDRFQNEAKEGTLAGSRDFGAAFSSLPASSVLRAYLGKQAVADGLSIYLGSTGARLAGAAGIDPDWISLSLRPFAHGLRLAGTVAGVEARNSANALTGQAPAGARLALAFNASSYGFDALLGQLSSNAKTARRVDQAEKYLRLSPADLAGLGCAGILVFARTPSALGGSVAIDPKTGTLSGRPELALELSAKSAHATARKIEKRLPALAAFLKGGLQSASLEGAGGRILTLGTQRIFVGSTRGRIYLGTSPAVFGPGLLSATPAFRRARNLLAPPARNAGLLYLDLACRTGAVCNPGGGYAALLLYLGARGGTLRVAGVLPLR